MNDIRVVSVLKGMHKGLNQETMDQKREQYFLQLGNDNKYELTRGNV